MRRYAVGFVDLFNNDLIVEIVEAEDWAKAIAKHSKIGDYQINWESLESVKEQFWDCDAMVDCVEIP